MPAHSQVIEQLAGIVETLNARIETLERERDEALTLLAQAWEWTTPSAPGKLGYVDLQQRVRAALARIVALHEER